MLLTHWETSGRPGHAENALKLPHCMKAMHRDLKASGFAKKDEPGRIVDFHSFRHSFAQRLKETGILFAVAMRMMRLSDPKLLASVYGDRDAFALVDFAAKLPGLSNGVSLPPDSSLESVVSCVLEAKHVAQRFIKIALQATLNELLSRLASHLSAMGQMAPAVGIEPTTYLTQVAKCLILRACVCTMRLLAHKFCLHLRHGHALQKIELPVLLRPVFQL